MNQSMFHLPYVEFYITNICNFNCEGCNRFNNYQFAGREKWKDLKHIYVQWSKVIKFDEISILGGEPLTSPDYIDWCKGILDLWPDSKLSIVTNGHYIKNNKELYDLLCDHRVYLNIGLHNVNRRQEVISQVKSWLVGPIREKRIPENVEDLPGFKEFWKNSYEKIKDSSWPNCDSVYDWDDLSQPIKDECVNIHRFSPDILKEDRLEFEFVDSNGVKVLVRNENFFHQGALKLNKTNSVFKLHDSDPDIAHSICHSKTCHHFMDGKLYKCGQVALFPEFYKQFNMDISDADLHLMHSYRPAEHNDLHYLKDFLGSIDQKIPQCKFCPENYEINEIYAEHGNKIKLQKKLHFIGDR